MKAIYRTTIILDEDLRIKLKKIAQICLFVTLFTLCFNNNIGAASNIQNNSFARSITYQFSENPAHQDDLVNVHITFINDDPNRARVEEYGIHLDWQATDIYYMKDITSTPLYIESTQSVGFDINFRVPINASVTSHAYKIYVHYSGWNGYLWSGADATDEKNNFQVKERPYPYSVSINPTSATLVIGKTQSFIAYCIDQYGAEYANVSYTWEVVGNIGTIDNDGTFTASSAGSGSVKVTASGEGKTVTSSASVTVLSSGGGGIPGFESVIFIGSVIIATVVFGIYTKRKKR